MIIICLFHAAINPVFNNAHLFRQGNELENLFPGHDLDTGLSIESDDIQDIDTRQLLGGQGESCRSPTTREMGICLDSGSCTLGGGRASGSCATGLVCCISKFIELQFVVIVPREFKLILCSPKMSSTLVMTGLPDRLTPSLLTTLIGNHQSERSLLRPAARWRWNWTRRCLHKQISQSVKFG